MKRAITFVAILASFLATTSAFAGKWAQEEIKWQISNVGAPYNATGIYVRDTTYLTLAVGRTDTTKSFGLEDANIMFRGITLGAVGSGSVVLGGGASTAGLDSTIVGWLCFQQDTSVAQTPTLSAVTIQIEGRVFPGGDKTLLSNGWVKQDSFTVNTVGVAGLGSQFLLGTQTLVVPIRNLGVYGYAYRFPELRARITATVGVMSAVRVFTRRWITTNYTP